MLPQRLPFHDQGARHRQPVHQVRQIVDTVGVHEHKCRERQTDGNEMEKWATTHDLFTGMQRHQAGSHDKPGMQVQPDNVQRQPQGDPPAAAALIKFQQSQHD